MKAKDLKFEEDKWISKQKKKQAAVKNRKPLKYKKELYYDRNE